MEAIEEEKQKIWRQKMNNRDVLKDDYEKQMVEKVFKSRMEK
jgi:hypothetical protein